MPGFVPIVVGLGLYAVIWWHHEIGAVPGPPRAAAKISVTPRLRVLLRRTKGSILASSLAVEAMAIIMVTVGALEILGIVAPQAGAYLITGSIVGVLLIWAVVWFRAQHRHL